MMALSLRDMCYALDESGCTAAWDPIPVVSILDEVVLHRCAYVF